MENNRDEFIQKNSPCGGFLQSNQWMEFQNNFGIKNHNISDNDFWSNILEYNLPLVGKYFYVPRGPIRGENIEDEKLKKCINDLIELAKINRASWIRMDSSDKNIRGIVKKLKYKLIKSPHDMQPKQIFVVDISKNEEEILSQMKPKTRYNIKVAVKNNVQIEIINGFSDNEEKIEKFLDLIEKTGNRKGITFHSKEYYRKMLRHINSDNIRLYLAVYEDKIIAGALMVIYGQMATYLHGASDDNNRNVMAPFLLQWQMIKDAKNSGALRYDFGGVSINEENKKRREQWLGVTRFKQGFAKNNQPLEFSGSYDIIINPFKYWTYRVIQKIKNIVH
ncbi:MAG: FemAB family protein [Candidatus Moranbacteria bacterium GW2011_GWE1_35_17]|nr:MAG: FemAB family protein [Candidatus Moranbacteria bacterium GW2011_GWE1_35_17]